MVSPLTLQGYPEEEARELLDNGCGAVLRERREASLALFTQAKKFLDWQVGLCFCYFNWQVGLCFCPFIWQLG